MRIRQVEGGHTEDGDAVRELLNVLPGGAAVQQRSARPEEGKLTRDHRNGIDLTWQRRTCEFRPSYSSADLPLTLTPPCDSLETNDNPPLSALLNLKHLDNRSRSPLDLIHDFLVDVDSVI